MSICVKVNRQSVCMGDDADNHSTTYTIEETTTFSRLFQDLISQQYFPRIYRNDVVWVLHCGEDDLVSWKTKENKLYSRFVTEELAILKVKRWRNITDIHFSYYSPPIKRARMIFDMFGGKKFHIWHEGFMSEYEAYNIPISMEEDWRKSL